MFWIVLAGVGFAILQVTVMDMGRWLAWDEAVYYSQGNPNVYPLGFNAHRSRGVSWLVTPVLLVTDSIVAMRLFLVVLSSIGFVLAFAAWRRTVSWGAVVGAVLFGTTWLGFTYGSELMPNLFSALAAMAALGLAVEYQAKSSKWLSVGVFIASGLTTLIRPLDGAVLVLAIGISVLVLRSSGFIRPFGTAALGALVIGIVPWVIESWARFDGPLQRLETTRDMVGSGFTNNIEVYTEMLGAPLTPGTVAADGWQVAAWLGVLVLLSLVGVVVGSTTRRASLIALITAGLMAAPYLFYSGAAAPRFMTPALGFLTLSAGIGLYAMSQSRIRKPALVVGGLIVLALMAFQIGAGRQWSEFQTESREVSATLGDILVEAAGQEPCSFISSYGYPQMAVRSGCHGARVTTEAEDNLSFLAEELAAGSQIFALVAADEPLRFLDPTWQCSKVPSLPDTRWQFCEPARDS